MYSRKESPLFLILKLFNISNDIFFRSEIQSLKKEITDQETSFKIQISAADKKASDYWVSFLY